MKNKKPRFIEHLERNGCLGSVISIDHLEELGAEIRSLHDRGLLHDDIFNYTGTKKPFHSPRVPRSLPRAKSIVIVATPQPILRVTFRRKGRSVRFPVPPTYFDSFKVARRARLLLAEAFKPEEYRFVRANLPFKLLAARSGLALYGKNNITYIPKYGSFYRPTAFYTDYDSPVDNWQEKKMLPLCEKCRACTNACPTGAIQKDRFLLKAEICLTFLNEKPPKIGFPEWVDPDAHNALIGCLRCQLVCPYDKGIKNWFEDRGRFTEEETEYLLLGKFQGTKAKRIEKKLRRVGLDLTAFPRNLEVLFAQEDRLDCTK